MSAAKALGMPNARPFTTDGPKKIFVIPRRELEDVHYARGLIGTGVDFSNYAAFEDDHVFGFTEAELRKFLKTVNHVVTERFGTGSPNVEKVRIYPRDRLLMSLGKEVVEDDPFLRYQFQLGRWSGRNSDAMAYVVGRILGPVLKRKVMLHVPHSERADYDERGAFHVHIWSSSSSTAERRGPPPRRIWDIPVDCRDDAFQLKPGDSYGFSIMDGAYAVAELLPNALYVHHDLVNDGSQNELRIMMRLCKEVATILGDHAAFAKFMAETRKAYAKGQQSLYVTVIQKGIPERASRHQEVVRTARAATEEARSRFFAASRNLFQLEQSLVNPKEVEKRFKAEITKLQKKKVAFVEGVAFAGVADDLKLRVFTDEIVAYDKETRKRHLLGRYEIVFGLQTGRIRFFNRDRMVDGTHGPHIEPDGNVCLGNISGEIAEYIANFEVESATTLAIAFLQNPNSYDAAGIRIRHYPEYVEPRKEAA